MKNTIHIPAKTRSGRATASIYCYPYNKETGKTMTQYIGSFRIDMDPDAVPSDLELEPGERRAGITITSNAPFKLQPEHLAIIKSWLEVNGTYRQTRAALVAHKEQVRATLKAELQEEIRREMEQEKLAARQALRATTVGLALVEAEAAVIRACEELLAEAELAVANGSKLSQRRSLNTTVREGMSSLDILQARANRIRVDAVAQLEQACQKAGLMVTPKRRAKSRKPELSSSPSVDTRVG
jgi:hypothetical protein